MIVNSFWNFKKKKTCQIKNVCEKNVKKSNSKGLKVMS